MTERKDAYAVFALDSGEFAIISDFYLSREAAQKEADDSPFDADVLWVDRRDVKSEATVGRKGYVSREIRMRRRAHDRTRKHEARDNPFA